MGCDIHCYPEFSTFESQATGQPYWQTLGNNMNMGRDYQLFGLMAGVRGQDVLFEPRGLPENLAFMTSSDNTIYVSDENPDEEGCCSPESAESWVRSGSSTWANDEKSSVTHPDWHSHSWLTPAEFRQVLEALGRDADVSCYAILAALEEIEKRGTKARLVFWFDN